MTIDFNLGEDVDDDDYLAEDDDLEAEFEERDDLSDKDFHPNQERSKRPYNPKISRTEGLLWRMQAAGSPVPRVILLSRSRKTKLENVKLHTPTKALAPSQYITAESPGGTLTATTTTPSKSKFVVSTEIETDDGDFAVLYPEDKVPNIVLNVPAKPADTIKTSPVPKASTTGMIDVPFTQAKYQDADKVANARYDQGKSARIHSQDTVMKTSAYNACHLAGIKVEHRQMNWCHFLPHEFMSDAGQTVDNIGLGTKFGNAKMELVNPAIRKVLYHKDGPKVLYVSAIPEWVEGFEAIRLLKKITYIIKDGPGNDYTRRAIIPFNMLSLDPIRVTAVNPVEKFLLNKFTTPLTPKVKTPQPVLAVKENLDPNSPLVFSPSFPRVVKSTPSRKILSPISAGAAIPASPTKSVQPKDRVQKRLKFTK